MIESTKLAVTIELTSDMLGTVPKNKDLYADYVASKSPEVENGTEEVETVQEVEEKGWTGFHSDDEGLFIYDYMVKGYLKAAIEVLQANGAVTKIPAYKKWIDQLVFVSPRRIHFGLTQPSGVMERPLRAMTAQGPRVSLARADTIAAGTELYFQVEVLKNSKKITPDLIESAFSYGQYCGLGQWRGSGGYGQFKVTGISLVQ